MKTILHKFLSVFRTLGEVYAREFRTIRRDQGVVLFFLFLPLAYPVIYSLIYNRELVRDVPMVVVDHDRTQQSRDLVRRMDAAQGRAWQAMPPTWQRDGAPSTSARPMP